MLANSIKFNRLQCTQARAWLMLDKNGLNVHKGPGGGHSGPWNPLWVQKFQKSTFKVELDCKFQIDFSTFVIKIFVLHTRPEMAEFYFQQTWPL